MNHCSILLFNWTAYGKGVGITTAVAWAVFFFYDYFIRGSEKKDSIFDNPSSKPQGFDQRMQVETETVEFDSMIP